MKLTFVSPISPFFRFKKRSKKGKAAGMNRFCSVANRVPSRTLTHSTIQHFSCCLGRLRFSTQRTNHKRRSNEIASLDLYLSLFDLKPDVPWGFNIYRCSYGNDKAWQRMLQLIDKYVRQTLELEDAMDLYPRHKPVIVEDKEKFDGATSHDVRDHFIAWVAEELPRVVSRPEKFFAEEESNEAGLRREWTLGTRYNFCLFVDDICMESLDEMKLPVVKLLWGQWGPLEPHERDYAVHPEYEDGETDEDDEDVGWMYMSVIDYMGHYIRLNEYDWWYDLYARPPYIIDEYEKRPGSWRKG